MNDVNLCRFASAWLISMFLVVYEEVGVSVIALQTVSASTSEHRAIIDNTAPYIAYLKVGVNLFFAALFGSIRWSRYYPRHRGEQLCIYCNLP